MPQTSAQIEIRSNKILSDLDFICAEVCGISGPFFLIGMPGVAAGGR